MRESWYYLVEDIVNIGVRIVLEMEELGVSFNSSTFMFGVDVRYEVDTR